MQDVNNVIQGSESAFRADEYAQRIQRTRERLSRAGVDVAKAAYTPSLPVAPPPTFR